MVETIAQIIGFVALTFNVLSYQFKTQKGVIFMMTIGCCLFCVNFFMLGAITGALLNAIGFVRCIVYYNKKFFKAESIWWFIGFCVLYVVTYVLNFTVFGKEFNLKNGLIEILPVIGMIATNISLKMKDAKHVRLLAYVSSPSWLIYNISSRSWGATVTEIIALISVTIGVIRLDIKHKSKSDCVEVQTDIEQIQTDAEQ